MHDTPCYVALSFLPTSFSLSVYNSLLSLYHFVLHTRGIKVLKMVWDFFTQVTDVYLKRCSTPFFAAVVSSLIIGSCLLSKRFPLGSSDRRFDIGRSNCFFRVLIFLLLLTWLFCVFFSVWFSGVSGTCCDFPWPMFSARTS